MVRTTLLKASQDLMCVSINSLTKYHPFLPSNALLLSKSIVASRLIVRCGVPSEGENVYWLGISKLTITSLDYGLSTCVPDMIYGMETSFDSTGKYCEALSATQTNLAVPA